jgi:hypothetical protein
MKNFFHFATVTAAALSMAACVDGLETDSDTGTIVDAFCMEDADASGSPDVYPDSGALSDGDYAGCEVYTGPVYLSYFPQPTCSGAAWSMTVETAGWASGGIVYVHNRGGNTSQQSSWWGEKHDLTDGSSEPNEWWDKYTLDLDVVATPNAVVLGSTTLNSCDTNNGTTLVWGIEVFDFANQTDTVDCIVVTDENVEARISAFRTAYPELSSCDELTGWTVE